MNILHWLRVFRRTPDSTVVGYEWTQVSGPEVRISNRYSETPPTFTAPSTPGTLVFRMTSTFDDGSTSFDEVAIDVRTEQP